METIVTATLTPQTSAEPADPDASTQAAVPIPVVAWVAFGVVLMWITYAFVGQNIAPDAWYYLHEFFHDGRHFLGIACH